MWGFVKGVIASTLFLAIAGAAPVKALKQTASPVVMKNGPAIIEAWLQKVVNARYAKEDAKFKAATVEKLEKVLGAPEEKNVVNKALEARLRIPGAPHLSHAATVRLRIKFALKLRQKIAARKERAARLHDDFDVIKEADHDGEDSDNVDMAQDAQTEENSQNDQGKEEIAHVSEDGSDSANVDTEDDTHTKEATEEKTEQDLSKAAEENTEDSLQKIQEQDLSKDIEEKTESSESSGEDSDGMAAFMQRLRLKKNRFHHRKHSSFLGRSHAKGNDDDDDSSNNAGSADSSDDATKALGNDYDQGSVDDQRNVETNTDENNEDASESESQGDEEEKAENPHDESDISSSDEDSAGMTLMQTPIRGKEVDLQWRLHKAHLATKVRRNRKASGRKQRSVVYQLRNAAADLERSVQKYISEDDKQAEVQRQQRDLSQETMKLRQDVDHELSEEPAPEKKAPEKKAPEKKGPPGKKAPPTKEAPAENDDSAAEKVDPYQMCKDLCKEDKGMDADSCVTDCRSYVDTGGDVNSLKEFVTDESYNEQGGESMEKKFEKMTGKKIPDCKPTIDLEVVPTFESVDKDGDHAISRVELDGWALTACVPNELAQQVFDVADSNFDEQVSKDEWKDVGEDLQTAQILDRYSDHETKGEDQYEPVDMPKFAHGDANDDKLLDQDEIMKMFKEEIKKRIPNMRDEDVDKVASQHQDAVMSDINKLDTDKDGFLNEEEFNAAEDQNMGHELHEVAQNPNNLPDPDDLHREDGAASASS